MSIVDTVEKAVAPEVPGLIAAFEKLGEMLFERAPNDFKDSLDRQTAKIERSAAEAALDAAIAAKFPGSQPPTE